MIARKEALIDGITNLRKLTVYERSVDNHRKTVPWISLQGDWLKQYGFDAGTCISVQCEDGKLIITPRKPDPPSPEVCRRIDELTSLSSKDLSILEHSIHILRHKK